MDRIKFANKIMTGHVMTKDEQRRCYELVKCKIIGSFGILNDIIDHVMLV